MDVTEFKTFLEKHEKGQELLDFHFAQIEQEKQRGIAEVRKRNAENDSIRRYKIAFENLGYDGQQDLSEFTANLKSAKDSSQQLNQKEMTLKELSEKFNKLQGDFSKTQQELESERQNAVQLRTKAKQEKLKGVLIDTLKDKVYGHDFIADNLITTGKIDLDESNKPVFVNDDKTVTPYEDGIKKLLESRPDIVKNGQRPGGGSTPTGSNNSNEQQTDQQRLARLRGSVPGGV